MNAEIGQSGMMLIQGNHLETLRDLMVAWVKAHPLSPLEKEHILVQSNGIAEWLKMALAQDEKDGGVGIAAAVDVGLPMRFLWDGYRSFDERIPEKTPFDKQPLTWLIYRLLDNKSDVYQRLRDDTNFAPLMSFLGSDDDPRRRYQLSQKLADLFDQYQVYRPDWLAAWQRGEDNLPGIGPSQKTKPVEENQQWQPALWRIIQQHVDHLDVDAVNASDAFF